jgi:hypothetical protein
MIKRTECVICRSSIEPLHSFKNFPIYMGVHFNRTPYTFEDMNWGACVKCGCVQLQSLVDLDILYQTPHNPAIGKTWKDHNVSFSKYIIDDGAKSLLDVGGANFKIGNLVCLSDSVESYTVIDLSVDLYSDNKCTKIKTIKGLIETINSTEKYDGIIISHTLEHMYNPISTLKTLGEFLVEDGSVFISVPNIENQLKDGFLNALNFEHTYYISEKYMAAMAASAGFEIVDTFEFSKYNLFYTFKKNKDAVIVPIADINQAKTIYKSHIEFLYQDVANINEHIGDRLVYCFGAHIFSQMLIAAGLNTNSLIGFLDNDTNKNGKCLYGTDIMVHNPSVLEIQSNPFVVLRVAQYREEIADGLIKINPDVSII